MLKKVTEKTKKAVKTTKKVTKKAKSKAQQLEELIWAEREQCESVCEINRGLISQYCRFAIMADELSLEIEQDQNEGDTTQSCIMAKLDLYEKISKQVQQLFKLLGLNAIKDQLASKRNQFLAALEDDD